MKRLFVCLVVALLGVGFATCTVVHDASAQSKPRKPECDGCRTPPPYEPATEPPASLSTALHMEPGSRVQ
jgi:hypothetical protein